MPINKQKIGVTAFIAQGKKVLLVRRALHEAFLPGYYELPGGKVEFGETTGKALIREIKEELGLEIEVGEPYSTFAYSPSNDERHTFDIQFVAWPRSNIKRIKLSREHDRFIWVNMAEINSLKLTPEMKLAIIHGFGAINR